MSVIKDSHNQRLILSSAEFSSLAEARCGRALWEREREREREREIVKMGTRGGGDIDLEFLMQLMSIL